MERYSGTQSMEVGAPVDPVSEWTVPGGETGLEGKYFFTAFEFHVNFT